MIVLAALVVAVLWAMTIFTGVRLVFPLRRAEPRSPASFLAALFAALALTLSFPPVYVFMDTLFGGRNLASLAQHTCLVLCSYFAARLLLLIRKRLSKRGRWLLLTSLIVTLVVQAVAFFAIEVQPTTVDLMLVSRGQIAALVFSMSHFLYFGVASAIAFVSGVSFFRTRRGPVARFSAAALAVGGVAGVLNVAVVALRDTARLFGSMSIEVLDPLYRVLIFVIAVGFCIGLGMPAVAGAVERKRIIRITEELEDAADRVGAVGWMPEHAVADRDAQVSSSDAHRRLSDVARRLRDAQTYGVLPESSVADEHPGLAEEKNTVERVDPALTARELDLLAQAERILQGERPESGEGQTEEERA